MLAALLLLLAGCSLREQVLKSAVREQADFIPDRAEYGGWSFEQVAPRVYSFRWQWARNLVVDTDEGWVVTDPYSTEAAQTLKGELEKIAPGKPVHTMFYSHYHLDHVRGGAPLKPARVIANAKCPGYWAALDASRTHDILPATELISGDQRYLIGGVEIQLLDLGLSHTDTLYAFYLPKERVLHTVDMALIRAVFPIGGPDMYTPGVLKALDRLQALDFDAYVPSHFGRGTRADFLEAAEFARDVNRLSLEVVGHSDVVTADDYQAAFQHVYEPLKRKYGHFHGFDAQILFVIGRSFSGALLGY